jgi:hypothetical protein
MITNVSLASTYTTLFTASTGTEQAVTTMFFCNTSPTTFASVDLFVTPNGRAISTSNQIISSLSLPATETFVFDAEKLILQGGDSINAKASVENIVVATISSVQTS